MDWEPDYDVYNETDPDLLEDADEDDLEGDEPDADTMICAHAGCTRLVSIFDGFCYRHGNDKPEDWPF